MKNKLNFKKILCFILMVLIIIPNVSFSAMALNFNSDEQIDLESSVSDTINTAIPPELKTDGVDTILAEQLKVLGAGEKALSDLKQMTLDATSLPEFIDFSSAFEKGHVNRVEEQEKNLNTVIYQNKDGSKSTYIFDYPVKYIDENGAVRDKSTQISDFNGRDYSYAATDNIIKTYFPSKSNTGIKIEINDFSIITSPISNNVGMPTKLDDNTIKYDGIFGEHTSVIYYTRLNGIKEDIVLNRNVGQNEFQFEMDLNNLMPFKCDDTWYLKNSNDQIVGYFGSIVITDAAGNSTEGTMNVVACEKEENYLITVVAPEEFLNSETTVYPVCIDPSTYIWEEGSYDYLDEYGYDRHIYYDAIQDTGLYSSYEGINVAEVDPEYHKLGTYNSVNGKIIYKLADFFHALGQYNHLTANQIGSVQLRINVGSGAACTLSVNPMTNTWDNGVVGENPLALCDNTLWSSYSTNNSSSTTISGASGEYSIDITEIVKGWARFNRGESTEPYNNPRMGFVLSSNSTSSRDVKAVEEFYINSVYVVIDTCDIAGDYYVNNFSSGKFLRKNGTYAVTTSLFSDTLDLCWQFEYIGNDKFCIRSSSNPNYALYGIGSDVELGALSNTPSFYYLWSVETAANGGVIIKNQGGENVLCYDGTTLSLVYPREPGNTNYKQTVWGLVEKDNYVNLTDFELSDNWLLPNSNKTFDVKSNATWTSNSCFTWSISSNGSANQNVFTVDANGKIYASQYGGTATLTLTHKMTGLTKSFTIKSGEFRDGIYMIMNIGTARYMDIEGPSMSAGAYIQQWDYHTGNQAKWEIELLPDGAYSIKSAYSGKWVTAGSNTSLTAIIQGDSSETPKTKWYITKTSSGNYKLSSASDSTKAIRVPNDANDNGTNLKLSIYGDDLNYRDEWLFENVGPTFGITSGDVYTIETNNSNLVLTAKDGKTADGTNIHQLSRVHGNQAQRWKIIYVGNGEYKIKNIKSTKFLTIAESALSNNASVELLPENNTSRQLFKIVENGDGTYSFYSKSSGYSCALVVGGFSSDPDVIIYQSDDITSNNSKFKIVDSNNAIIIVPGFGGSVLQMGATFPSNWDYENIDIFSSNRFDLINLTQDEFLEDIIDILIAAGEIECEFEDLDEFLAQAVAEAFPGTNMRDVVESLVLMLSLRCDSNGTSCYDIEPKLFNTYEPEDSPDKYGYGSIYKDLFIQMQNAALSDGPFQGYDVSFFSYDWRMSCADSAAALNSFIGRYDYDKVVLVCHSMGGLVGSAYMAIGESKANKVEKYISLGTPHLGTVATPTICLVGASNIFWGSLKPGTATFWESIGQNLFTDVLVQFILSNFPSVYEAMPTEQYVEATGGYLTYDDDGLCTTYSETKAVIAKHMKGYKEALMLAAEDFHDSLYVNGSHITANTDSLYIYSLSEKTVQWLTYDPKLFGIYFKYTYSWNVGGDSLIPAVSASLNNANNAETFDTTHMGLVDICFDSNLNPIPEGGTK